MTGEGTALVLSRSSIDDMTAIQHRRFPVATFRPLRNSLPQSSGPEAPLAAVSWV